jgi:4-amino-4-deoxy-L-arabinose transferase-like glycosyltransferase
MAPPAASRTTRNFRRALLVIVLAALAFRVGYVLIVTQFDTGFYDAAFYELEAKSVADGRGFVNPFPGPHSGAEAADHPPLTVVALVPAAELPGDSQLWMRFTMALLGTAVVALIALLGRRVGGERVGLIAAGIAALYPNLWMNDGLLMSETLAALTTVGALLLAYRMLRRPTWGVAAALGAVCGLAALTRAELVLLVPFLALPVAWCSCRDHLTARLRAIGVSVAAAALIMAPWIGFNLARFEQPTFLSTGDGIVLLGSNCATTYHGPAAGFWSLACLPAKTPRGDQSVEALRYRNLATDYIRGHKGRLPVVVLARFGRLLGVYTPGQIARYNAGEGRPRWASYLGIASFLALLPLAAAGGIWLRRRRLRIWLLFTPVWVVVISAAVFYGTPRFRVPAEPTVVVLVAVGIGALLGRRWPHFGPEPPPEAERPIVATAATAER